MSKGLAPADVIAHDENDVRLLARHLSLRGSCKVEKRRHEHDRYHPTKRAQLSVFFVVLPGAGILQRGSRSIPIVWSWHPLRFAGVALIRIKLGE
jgi:hypothetical protein